MIPSPIMGMLACVVLGLAASAVGLPAAAPDSTDIGSEASLRAYAQGRLHEVQGEVREALADYARALGIDPGAAPIARHVAELVGRSGDAHSALEYADRALQADPDDARALWIKADALSSLGRAAEALPLLERSVAADSNHLEYVLSLGHTAETLDRVDVVERAYARAVELDEDDPENWFQLAAAQARLGEFAEADRSLEQASELGPLRPGHLFLQGWIDEGLNKPHEAIDVYRQHLAAHPDDQVTRRRLVNLLSRAHQWNEAYAESRRVTPGDPPDWETLQVAADLAFKSHHPAEAHTLVNRMGEQVGADPDRAGRLAGVLIRNGETRDAYRRTDAWVANHPEDPRGPLLAARVHALAGDKRGAREFAQRAIQAAPDSIPPRLVLARLDTDLKRYDEAERAVSEARQRHPDDVDLVLELATVREMRGDSAGAETAARDALRLGPANARALNFLGYLLADHSRNLPEAERLIQQALGADPDNGAYIDSLGWVYYRLGRLQEAKDQLERAVDLTGGDAVVREHLGDVYLALHQNDRARDQYRRALAEDASNARLRAKLARLAR